MIRKMLLIVCFMNSLLISAMSLTIILFPETDWAIWPQRWLVGTPFQDLRFPGILFMIIIGLLNAWGFWNVFKENPKQYDRAMLGGYVLIGWVASEILLSRELYLIHVSALLIGALQVLMAYRQKNKWAV
jgi:hypothetical protein